MIEKTTQLEQLKKLLIHKKSKRFYAQKLGTSIEMVDDLLKDLRGDGRESDNEIHSKNFVNVEKGTFESCITSDFEPKSIEELIKLHKIDTGKYKISNYWTKQRGNKFTSSLFCTLIKPNDKEKISEKFSEFLKTYTPKAKKVKKENNPAYNKACLILPKQDAHFNKYDINGDNNIDERFDAIYEATNITLFKSSAFSNIEKVFYIVGSDQFNSEFTQTTTKGTPQTNILDYNTAFTLICNHEVEIINLILEYSDNVEVLFIPGNHDEYVGWHLAEWLKAYFREETRVVFSTDIKNRKYDIFGNTALMFNHGDALKPNELAHKFPIEFRVGWSQCSNFLCFTGDKHHEMSKDIHGIKFYQVPQLSNAKSRWDDKEGHTCSKAEMMSFLIDSNHGITDIYKTPIK